MFARQDENENFNKLLWLIAAVALFFRAWGMWFGLPLLFNPDEPIFVNAALHMGSEKTLNPHWFGNPGNILIYLLFFETVAYYLIGHIGGIFASAAAFRAHLLVDPTVPYLMGRALGVIAGTLTVVAIGHVGKRLVNARVGLVAAILLTVDPLAVEHAKYIRTDILGTLFVVLAVFYGLKFLDTRQRRAVILSSLATGLAAATKYPFAMVGMTILLLAFFLWRESSNHSGWERNSIKLFGVSCLIMLIAFFCVTPFLFFDWRQAWHDIVWEARGTHLGHESLPLPENYWWYISSVFVKNSGLPIMFAAAGGLVIAWRNIDKRQVLVLAFPLLFFLFIGAGRLRWSRWMIPVFPFIAIYAASAWDFGVSRIFSMSFWQRQKRELVTALAALLLTVTIGLGVAYPVQSCAINNYRFCLPDTRQLCTKWIRENLTAGKFALEFYTFQPYPRYSYFQGDFEFETYEISQTYSVAGKSLSEYRGAGFDYLVISSWIYNRYLQDAKRYPQEERFYRALLVQTPLCQFEATSKINGPHIAIYAIN